MKVLDTYFNYLVRFLFDKMCKGKPQSKRAKGEQLSEESSSFKILNNKQCLIESISLNVMKYVILDRMRRIRSEKKRYISTQMIYYKRYFQRGL